jgi:hypothetical protein
MTIPAPAGSSQVESPRLAWRDSVHQPFRTVIGVGVALAVNGLLAPPRDSLFYDDALTAEFTQGLLTIGRLGLRRRNDQDYLITKL